jgi:hypothetical protein
VVIIQDQGGALEVEMGKLLFLLLALDHALSRPLVVNELLLSPLLEEVLVLLFLLLPFLIPLHFSFFALLMIYFALNA